MFKFLEAVLMLSGMIIGAGMFAIPFSFARAGFILGVLELLILGGIVLWMHLAYGEIVLNTPSRHRLPGFVRIYLGRHVSWLAWGSAVFGIIGALVVYIILGSFFLRELLPAFLSGVGGGVLAAVFSAAGAAIVISSLRKEALINSILTAALIGFIVFLSFSLMPQASLANLAGAHMSELFFPYGVLLFALTGATAIPELIPLLGRSRRKVHIAIIVGSLIPVLVYFFFALGVVGTVGEFASKDAIQGLRPVAGEGIVKIGSLIGLLAVFTSFTVLTTALGSLLALDFRMKHRSAFAASVIIPLTLYLFGFKDFISVIGIVGALAVGIDAALILAVYRRMRTMHGLARSRRARFAELAVYTLVVAGVVAQIFSIFQT